MSFMNCEICALQKLAESGAIDNQFHAKNAQAAHAQ